MEHDETSLRAREADDFVERRWESANRSDGRQAIPDIVSEDLHQRTPLFIGAQALVAEAEAFLQRFDRQ